MMENPVLERKNERLRRFHRLVAALEAAERWQLHRTRLMYLQALEAIGYWRDDAGDWREDTRPVKPIDDAAAGTWADHHADF